MMCYPRKVVGVKYSLPPRNLINYTVPFPKEIAKIRKLFTSPLEVIIKALDIQNRARTITIKYLVTKITRLIKVG